MSDTSDIAITVESDEPPPEIKAYIIDTRDLLGLGEWDITVRMVDTLGEEANADMGDGLEAAGDCTFQEPYRVAAIRLVRGRSPDAYREIVMHELLHCVVAPLQHAAQQLVVSLLPKRLSDHALELIQDGTERSITPLAKALVRGIRAPSEPVPMRPTSEEPCA